MASFEAVQIAAALWSSQNKRLINTVIDIIFDEKVDGRKNKRGKKRKATYYNCVWSEMLLRDQERLEDDSSREGKEFRLRFRVPYKIFTKLVEWTKLWREQSVDNPDGTAEFDACGNPRIPTTLLVLGCLRILGRGTCLDGILELSGISTTTMDRFFHKWCKNFRNELFPKFVYMPSSQSEIAEAMGPFAAVGFPGAIGSIDVVHVRWDKCPKIYTNLFTGKEGYCTIAYQVICDHSGKAISATSGFYGYVCISCLLVLHYLISYWY
jgi:hypothetical protein